jgi:hypothetical protein
VGGRRRRTWAQMLAEALFERIEVSTRAVATLIDLSLS